MNDITMEVPDGLYVNRQVTHFGQQAYISSTTRLVISNYKYMYSVCIENTFLGMLNAR